MKFVVYTDSDQAGDWDDRTSTSAFVIYLISTHFSWTLKKQKTIAHPSTEADFELLHWLYVFELCWLQPLLKELHCKEKQVPIVLYDNLSATYTCANPVFHTRMKHLTLDYFFVREKVNAKELEVKHIPSTKQIVDVLKKLLAKTQFQLLIDKLSVATRPPSLPGNIRHTHVLSQLSLS